MPAFCGNPGRTRVARYGVAAEITLARYTHTLPEDVEQAREKLSVYVAERQATKATGQ